MQRLLSPAKQPSLECLSIASTEAENDNTSTQAREDEAWTPILTVTAYSLIWLINLCFFVYEGVETLLLPSTLSDIDDEYLLPLVMIMSLVLSSASRLLLARFIMHFSRALAVAISTGFMTIGLVILAMDLGFVQYSIGQIFRKVGTNGINYCQTVFISEISPLRDRSLLLGMVLSPMLIAYLSSGAITQVVIAHANAWSYHLILIVITPAATSALGLLFHYASLRHTERYVENSTGDIYKKPKGVMNYIREFNPIGILLFSAAGSCLLLGANNVPLQGNEFGSPLILSLSVLGVVSLMALIAWERLAIHRSLTTYGYLRNRTILAACIANTLCMASLHCWKSYFIPFIQVVDDRSIMDTGFLTPIHDVAATIGTLVFGLIIRHFGVVKCPALYLSVLGAILGLGLATYSLRPDSSTSLTIAWQIIAAFAQSLLTTCIPIAIAAATGNRDLTTLVAICGLFEDIGAAIGYSLASIIWQETLPQRLNEYFPTSIRPEEGAIYGSLSLQLLFKENTLVRKAIQMGYCDTERIIFIVSTILWMPILITIFLWGNFSTIGI